MYLSLDEYLNERFGDNPQSNSYSNLTSRLVTLFEKGIKNSNNQYSDFSGIFLCLGVGGSGKTTTTGILTNIILENAIKYKKKWECALYKTPDSLLKEIQNVAPPQISERFHRINDIEQVEPYQIVWIDEGVLHLGNMKYRDAYAQEFLDNITFSRHKNSFYLINSLDDGVFYRLRTRLHVIIYKNMNRLLLESPNFHDTFAKNNIDIITRLKPTQSLIDATNWKFFKQCGFLAMHYKNYCSWMNDSISKNMANEADVNFKRKMEHEALINDKIQEIIYKFPELITKTGGLTFIKGYLAQSDPKFFEKFSDQVQKIYQQAYYLIKIGAERKIPDEFKVKLFLDDWLFPEFLKHNIEDKELSSIMYYYNMGHSQEEVAQKVGLSKPYVNEKINLFKHNKRLGYMFEGYWNYLMKGDGIIACNKNIPDFIDKKGTFREKDYAHSCKYLAQIGHLLHFKVGEDCLPELKYAVEHKQPHFYLPAFNPKWDYSCIYVSKVPVVGSDEIYIDRNDFPVDQSRLKAGKLQILTNFEG